MPEEDSHETESLLARSSISETQETLEIVIPEAGQLWHFTFQCFLFPAEKERCCRIATLGTFSSLRPLKVVIFCCFAAHSTELGEILLSLHCLGRFKQGRLHSPEIQSSICLVVFGTMFSCHLHYEASPHLQQTIPRLSWSSCLRASSVLVPVMPSRGSNVPLKHSWCRSSILVFFCLLKATTPSEFVALIPSEYCVIDVRAWKPFLDSSALCCPIGNTKASWPTVEIVLRTERVWGSRRHTKGIERSQTAKSEIQPWSVGWRGNLILNWFGSA